MRLSRGEWGAPHALGAVLSLWTTMWCLQAISEYVRYYIDLHESTVYGDVSVMAAAKCVHTLRSPK